MLLVSLVSLSTLWAFAASIALGDGLNLRNVTTVQDHFGYPSGALGSALQAERRLSAVYLGSKSPVDQAAMESGRLVTDRQVDLFRKLAMDKNAQSVAPATAKQLVTEILTELNGLTGKRAAIDFGSTSRARVFTEYTDTVKDLGTLQGSLSTLSNPDVARDARNQIALTRAREALSQEDALLAGALAAKRMTGAEHSEFTKLVGTQRSLYSLAAPELRVTDQTYYQRITTTPEYARLRSLEDQFVSAVRRLKAGDGTDALWKTTADSNLTRLRGLELSTAADSEQRAKPIATNIILRVVLAGVLGLVAVLASLILAIWIARSVIRDLTGLKREALDLANVRLPDVIQRLRRGQEVDVAAEAPPLAFSTNEIDQVGQAFNAARRTAIQSAVEEAALRRSISDVFVNLARRSQALLHRQLNLLDAMERRIADPDELDDLFRLDHLATRMRRHAEGLIILSGQAPGRGWRSPVAVIDVARAAASEVEDYTRVAVDPMPQAAIAGIAVADVIHLLAELIENATSFSSPQMTVRVSGHAVAHGFSLEIEDRGLSMDAKSLASANERLAAPEFDLSNSAQLGLFVVGRLARRHNIKVTLRTSPYGGMTAIVLLPDDIVVRDDEPAMDSGAFRSTNALVPAGALRSDRQDGRPGPVLRLHSDEQAPRSLPAQRPPDPAIAPRAATGRPREQSVQEAWRGEGTPGRPVPFERPRQAPQPSPGPPANAPNPSGNAPNPPGNTPRQPGAAASPPGVPPGPPGNASSPPGHILRQPGNAPGQLGGGRPPLPQRVRQANLAPQLYEDDREPAPGADVPSERSPEELRTMMSAFQKGTLRGRSEAVETDKES